MKMARNEMIIKYKQIHEIKHEMILQTKNECDNITHYTMLFSYINKESYLDTYNKKNIEKQILEINSKHCVPILNNIKEEEGITQGQLAIKMGLLPSGLSAVTKKMENSAVPLIIVTQIGKYRQYKLPEYMKQYLIDLETQQNDSILQQLQEENLFLLLQRFVDIAGDNWKELLNYCLLSEDLDTSSKIGKAFINFMDQMVKKTLIHDESVDGIRIFIKNQVLLYLIDQYIEAVS
ncbi:MAG: hypothetical protein HFG28_04190 [Eubacterium sp.]|jgi:hypothetical protein|nr:hypothetical protein [Eubacterium sp.]